MTNPYAVPEKNGRFYVWENPYTKVFWVLDKKSPGAASFDGAFLTFEEATKRAKMLNEVFEGGPREK